MAINAVLATLAQHGAEQISSDGLKPPEWLQWFDATFIDPLHQPWAVREETPLAQLY